MQEAKLKVLFVDDERAILEGFEQNLRKEYDVLTATSGRAAMELMGTLGVCPIIVSDMRMPIMNGATFLSLSKEKYPDSIRILLTGQTDIDSAIAAINNGQIFRFLTKPCDIKQLKETLADAAKQYRLVTAEKELLQKTLKGAIKTLTDALSMTSPIAFGRSKRLHKSVAAVCHSMKIRDGWAVEIAALLSELGAITLTDDVLEKYYKGESLSETERLAVMSMPVFTQQLIANIPRLEKVVQLLQDKEEMTYGDVDSPEFIPAQILIVADDLEKCLAQGMDYPAAMETLVARRGRYNHKVMEAYLGLASANPTQKVSEISVGQLKPGMVFVESVFTRSGLLLVSHGYEVNDSFIARTKGFRQGYIREPLRVVVPTTGNYHHA